MSSDLDRERAVLLSDAGQFSRTSHSVMMKKLWKV